MKTTSIINSNWKLNSNWKRRKDKSSMECAIQCGLALTNAGVKNIRLSHLSIIQQYLEDWHRVMTKDEFEKADV